MKSKANQSFDATNTNTITTNIEWESLDIYALFRNAKNLGYFEIGPKMSMISRVASGGTESTLTDRPEANYNKNLFAGVLGFGANIMGNDGRFSGILGLRFEYAFSDLDTDAGKSPLNNYTPGYTKDIYLDGNKSSNLPIILVEISFS